jgi:hypothetical protein
VKVALHFRRGRKQSRDRAIISGLPDCIIGDGKSRDVINLRAGRHQLQTTFREQADPDAGRQPAYYYTALDGSPLTFVGLWDEWKDIETGLPLSTSRPIPPDAVPV